MFEEWLKTSIQAVKSVEPYQTFAENRLARVAVARLYSTRPSRSAGSITLIHGAPGIGKTHLSLWTLKELRQRHSTLKFAYATAQDLSEMLLHAERRQSLAELLEKFQSLDVLVCEDLHWLEANPHAHGAFLTLIESLEHVSTRILITSQKPVGEMRSLDQRLISRCHGGICMPLSLPGVDSRTQLFQQWFQEFRLPILKPFVASARYLAEQLPVTPRELRKAVLALIARQQRHPAPIDVIYLERWLNREKRIPHLSFDTIVQQVAHEFGVPSAEIRSRSRQQRLAVPRQCAMWLARELMERPLEQIGKYFDRSHTTVSHSLTRLTEMLPTNPSLRQQVQKLRQQLNELQREDCA